MCIRDRSIAVRHFAATRMRIFNGEVPPRLLPLLLHQGRHQTGPRVASGCGIPSRPASVTSGYLQRASSAASRDCCICPVSGWGTWVGASLFILRGLLLPQGSHSSVEWAQRGDVPCYSRTLARYSLVSTHGGPNVRSRIHGSFLKHVIGSARSRYSSRRALFLLPWPSLRGRFPVDRQDEVLLEGGQQRELAHAGRRFGCA